MRPIKVDSWVKTADGTEGRVTYISPEGEAQIMPKNAAGHDPYIRLPVSELRRTTEVARPPIAGMPTERPTCLFCGKPLKPVIDTRHELQPYRIISRTFKRWDQYGEGFCTLKCALGFANASARAGYRITGDRPASKRKEKGNAG